MRTNKASSWTRNVPTERQAPTAQPKRKSPRTRKARRYTVSSQDRYAQKQGTATRGPMIAAKYWYTDSRGNVYAKWNEYDEWERVA